MLDFQRAALAEVIQRRGRHLLGRISGCEDRALNPSTVGWLSPTTPHRDNLSLHLPPIWSQNPACGWGRKGINAAEGYLVRENWWVGLGHATPPIYRFSPANIHQVFSILKQIEGWKSHICFVRHNFALGSKLLDTVSLLSP